MERERSPKPRWLDVDLTIEQMTDGISYYWEAFYAQDPVDRLNDEAQYSDMFIETLDQMGVFDRGVSAAIVDNAKTIAQERLCKFDEELALLTREC
jgi:hypothetical protein